MNNIILLLETKAKEEQKTTGTRPSMKLSQRTSPLRYPGGKNKMISLIYQFMNSNKKTFIDAYSGGGSVGLSLLTANAIERLTMNDIDESVNALFSTTLENPEELIRRIHQTDLSRETFFKSRNILKNPTPEQTKEDIAIAMLIVNRCSFSGIWNANPCTIIDSRWTPDSLERRIRNIHAKKSKITLTRKDAIQTIKENHGNPDATIFIDPPYYAKGQMLYKHAYEEQDHIRLAETIQELWEENRKAEQKGKERADLIITYDDHEAIKELYRKTSTIIPVNRYYSLVKN